MKKSIAFLLVLVFVFTSISFSGNVLAQETLNGWYHLEGTEDVSVGKMAYLEPTDGISELIQFDVNSTQFFTDRSNRSSVAVPDCFRGALLLRNSMDKGTKFRAASSGDVYVMTPTTGYAWSQQTNLQEKGFSVVASNITDLFTGLVEKIVLMKKTVTAGTEISIAKYSIVFSANPSVIVPDVYTYPDDSETIEESLFVDESGADVTYGYVDDTRLWQGISGIEYIEYSRYEQSGKTDGGRLWATWYSGGRTENIYNYVVLATSDDDGENWTDARVIIDPDNIGSVRAFDPVLWTDPNGKMWVFWNQENGLYSDDSQKGVWGMYTENPYEQDPVWSEPLRLCNGVMMNKPTVIDDENGEKVWLLCSYIKVEQTAISAEYGPNIYKFVGYGKGWETFANINGEKEIVPVTDFLEHILIQNEDGSLRVLVRSSAGVRDVVSADYGKTWTGGGLMTDADGNIISTTASRVYIGRIKDNDGQITGKTQLLVYHNNTTGARDNLTAAVSEDGGKTWPYKLILESTVGCSYPDAVQISDGTIYVTYDFDRYGLKQILFARITVDDIKAGKIVNEQSKLQVVINQNGKNIDRGWYHLEGTEDVSVNDMAYLEPTDGVSQLVEFDVGTVLFTDRPLRTALAVPDCFKGALLLKNSLDKGTTFKTVSSGTLYVMTPMTGYAWSQQASLEEQGFSVAVADIEKNIFSDLVEKMVLMKKTVIAGTEFSIGKYSIVFSGTVKISGDINCDGNYDVFDLTHLKKKLLGVAEEKAYYYDSNGDGKVDILDIIRTKKVIAGIS